MDRHFHDAAVVQVSKPVHSTHMNNNPEEVGTLGHLLVTARLQTGSKNESCLANRRDSKETNRYRHAIPGLIAS